MRPEIILMKRVLLLAASALVLTALVPEPADAQGRRFGVRAGVVRGPVIARRGPVYGYGYRRGVCPRGGGGGGFGVFGGGALGGDGWGTSFLFGFWVAGPCPPSQQGGGGGGEGPRAVVRVG